jgi:tRNA threonylcarbamoyladenosine biosynthesis protein TsaB
MPGSRDKSLLVLGIDTCGVVGSVALGLLHVGEMGVLGEVELEGRSYSARLVAAVDDLLKAHGAKLRDVGVIVAVSGPGSFTGVRVGLSAVKGFVMGAGMPVVAVSRLEVLSGKAGVDAAALDAHRGEVFLRLKDTESPGRELLAGAEELAALPAPKRVAVCDAAAETLLATAWPRAELVKTDAPTAVDALRLAVLRILAKEFADPALLDGNYLRRSDAEIHFGEPAVAAGQQT